MDYVNDLNIDTETLTTTFGSAQQSPEPRRPAGFSTPDNDQYMTDSFVPPDRRKRQLEARSSTSGRPGEKLKCFWRKAIGSNNTQQNSNVRITSPEIVKDHRLRQKSWKDRKSYQKIEYLSCALFPLIYISFLIWYWYSHTSKSNN